MNNLVAISGLGGCGCAAPMGEYFAAQNGMGEYFAQNGMGAYARPLGEDPAAPLPKWVPVVVIGGIVLGAMWAIHRLELVEAG